MYKKYYSHFLNANPNILHFAAHSHHYWPDVTLEAQKQYWFDSANFVDDKWEKILGEKKEHCTQLIAKIIEVSHPEQIVFAPNTLELIFRLLTTLDWTKKIKILTTPNEFHSFRRLSQRLKELPQFEIVTEEISHFEKRIQQEKFDVIFFSRVLFNSGIVVKNWEELIEKIPDNTIISMDDYHGFMAVPISLSKIQNKIFYLAGGYKYAQGGEGACFMYIPKGKNLRPFYTGWFADFAHLEDEQKTIEYANDGMGFAGATMDFTAMYRLLSVLELFEKEKITIEQIHQYIQNLQKDFLENSSLKNFIGDTSLQYQGHFLTYQFSSVQETKNYVQQLRSHNIIVDARGERLRFGFGMYHDNNDVKLLIEKLQKIKM